MKEVTCICGERVVFLDPEVETKTCPNCGMPVRQYEIPAADVVTIKTKRASRAIGKKTFFFVGVVAALLAIGMSLMTISVSRRSALNKAAIVVREAEASEKDGDLAAAAAAYRRAVRTYRSWSAPSDVLKPLEAALVRIENRIAEEAAITAPVGGELLPIPLEEVARLAYAGSPDSFRATFDREYAGRAVVLRGRVEDAAGPAYKASALTISYKVFSPAGERVDLAFDNPFFERYRLKSGTDCIVKVVLSKMYSDPGGPGETGHWVLLFDGVKSSLITDTEDLKGLGWKLDDDITNLAASQRSLSPAY